MNLYTVLGVEVTASPEQIEKAYRKLAREHHPDRNIGDEGAEKRFNAIQRAYDVLSNSKRREHYDKTGEEGDTVDHARRRLIDLLSWCMGEVFNIITEQGLSVMNSDFVKMMKEHFGEKIKQCKKANASAPKTLTELKEMTQRFKVDREPGEEEPENLLQSIVNGQIAQINKQVEGNNTLIKEYGEAIKFLKKYQYEFIQQVRETKQGGFNFEFFPSAGFYFPKGKGL